MPDVHILDPIGQLDAMSLIIVKSHPRDIIAIGPDAADEHAILSVATDRNHVINIGDPGHTHVINVTESAHQHTYQFPASVGATLGGTTLFAGGATPALTSATAAGVTASANAAGTGIYANSNNTGSGAAFSIVPQYLSFNFIIKVF